LYYGFRTATAWLHLAQRILGTEDPAQGVQCREDHAPDFSCSLNTAHTEEERDGWHQSVRRTLSRPAARGSKSDGQKSGCWSGYQLANPQNGPDPWTGSQPEHAVEMSTISRKQRGNMMYKTVLNHTLFFTTTSPTPLTDSSTQKDWIKVNLQS